MLFKVSFTEKYNQLNQQMNTVLNASSSIYKASHFKELLQVKKRKFHLFTINRNNDGIYLWNADFFF